MTHHTIAVCLDDTLGQYGFEGDHPFSTRRYFAFTDELERRHLFYQVQNIPTKIASDELLCLFHTPEYLQIIQTASAPISSYHGDTLGDTPMYHGVYQDAARVVGTVVNAVHGLMAQQYRRAFVPIAGLHHAMPDQTAGFCVFNDIGVAIKLLQKDYNLQRIAYIDIDAHHGDGVYYPFEDDPKVIFADIHEDGHYVFPKTGFAHEQGKGQAYGKKLNLSLLPLQGDQEFFVHWQTVMAFLHDHQPDFVIFQAGCDGLSGDPLAHLHYSLQVHERVTRDLCYIADRYAEGRLLGLGGGGYHLHNLARAWGTVVETMLQCES